MCNNRSENIANKRERTEKCLIWIWFKLGIRVVDFS